MEQDQITALAREYAEGTVSHTRLSTTIVADTEDVIRFLLRRFCFVEKSKASDLCRLTLEHDQSVDYGLIDGLTDIVLEVFPKQYRQVAEELSNPEIAKEVEE